LDLFILFKISYIVHVLARIQSVLSHPQALIIVPTVELAFTVGSGIEKMSVYLPNIQITYATSSFVPEEFIYTPIIIGTIDTFDLFQSLIDFSQVEILIIDEIDTMIIREDYRQNLLNLMDNLSLINPCQILIYSSTLSEQVMNFTNELIPNSILIKQRLDKQQLSNIEQFYVQCNDDKEKFDIVNLIIEQFNHTQILIFCADDQITEKLNDKIRIENKNE
jgi:ATP-dependent RNA helicase DDX19/DBP5